jgi:hypothetical protein
VLMQSGLHKSHFKCSYRKHEIVINQLVKNEQIINGNWEMYASKSWKRFAFRCLKRSLRRGALHCGIHGIRWMLRDLSYYESRNKPIDINLWSFSVV